MHAQLVLHTSLFLSGICDYAQSKYNIVPYHAALCTYTTIGYNADVHTIQMTLENFSIWYIENLIVQFSIFLNN